MSSNAVRVDLDAIDDWKVTLGEINSACMQDIAAIKQIVSGEMDGFKGHTADVAKDFALELLEQAETAHTNLDGVQKTLTNVQVVKSDA